MTQAESVKSSSIADMLILDPLPGFFSKYYLGGHREDLAEFREILPMVLSGWEECAKDPGWLTFSMMSIYVSVLGIYYLIFLLILDMIFFRSFFFFLLIFWFDTMAGIEAFSFLYAGYFCTCINILELSFWDT